MHALTMEDCLDAIFREETKAFLLVHLRRAEQFAELFKDQSLLERLRG